jgi:MoxR-like ATPase
MATPAQQLRSCRDCPSFLEPDRVVTKFKKSIGSPMCGRFGIVLGKPGGSDRQTDKLSQHYAPSCVEYGNPLPPLPTEYRLGVAMPIPELREPAPLAELRNGCSSCLTCSKFITEETVMEDFGWTAGLCGARGKLILANRSVYEARACEYRALGTNKKDTLGVHLLPEYEDAFQLAVEPVAAYFKAKGNLVEPHDYPSDKEVTDEEATSGIRAWRRVPDPAGSGNEAFLPIYRLDFFSADERDKIPKTGDEESPELYVDHFGGTYLAAVAWTELDETPTAWGEPGVGKTELFRYLAWLMCLPFERVSITGQTDLDDLAGSMRFTPDRGTWFQYGRLPRAWSKPGVLVIDEPNVGPPDVWQFLRPLTDNSKQMVLDMNEGERIKRDTDCYLGMAMNPAWDIKNVGAMPISGADADRLFHVFIELPPESLEREIILNRVKKDGWELDMDRLNMLMGIAKDLRALATEGELQLTWGLRQQIKVARALRWFDPITAYRRAVADYLEPEAQSTMLDAVRAHVDTNF